jgi:hypothetical protein
MPKIAAILIRASCTSRPEVKPGESKGNGFIQTTKW